MPTKKRTTRKPVRNEMMSDEKYYTVPTPRSQPSNLLILLLIGVSFLAGYLFFKVQSLEQAKNTVQQTGGQEVTTVKLDDVKKLFAKGFMHFGDANRKVLFVEFSDPSCPFCHVAGGKDPELSKQMDARFQYNTDGGSYIPPVTEMRKLVDEGKASYVHVYAPGHGNGELAIQALYCANDKGDFWDVHDKLMSNAGYTLINDTVKNDTAQIPTLVQFLTDVTDGTALQKCLTDQTYKPNIDRDYKLAQSLGYQGTPHFIVNTAVYGGAQSYDVMKTEVDKALGN